VDHNFKIDDKSYLGRLFDNMQWRSKGGWGPRVTHFRGWHFSKFKRSSFSLFLNKFLKVLEVLIFQFV